MAMFRRAATFVLGFAATLLGQVLPAQAEAPLRVGLLPYMSTHHLIKRYQPLKTYLEATLGCPVVLSTAPDFRTYVDRARRGEYDLYHTAPHFAALAERESGYRRIGRMARDLDGSVVVAKDSAIHDVADLRGKTVTAPDKLAIVTFLGELLLKDHGLTVGDNVEMRYTPSHNNAVLAVARQKSDAAVTSAAVFEKMPVGVRNKLRILTETRKVPHMMFMAGPALSEEEYHRLRRAILNFTADGPGKAFFQATGYGDIIPITDADMQSLTPFLTTLKARLAPPHPSGFAQATRP